MWPLIGGICLLLLFILIIGRKANRGLLIERLAVIWFKIAWSVFLLFIVNLMISNYGFVIPINLFSTFAIAILGVPGVLCLVALNFF